MLKKKKTVNDFEKSNMTYFKEIAKFKSLTKEEEYKLWDLYRNHGDLSARDKLIESNLKFVASIAKNYQGRGLSYSDLISEGNLGLIKSFDKFDTSKNYKTFTYSVWWIRQSILEAIKERNGVEGEDLPFDYECHCDTYTDNDDCLQRENETMTSFISDDMDNYFRNKDMHNAIELMMSVLNDKEKFMISEYYGLSDGEPKTLEEIGIKVGLTKERVRQINKASFSKMRAAALDNSITSDIYK